MNHSHRNVVLIGMPGSGKSTVGRILARNLGRPFIDTDMLIEAQSGKPLSGIIAEVGLEGFKRVEEATLLALNAAEAVIATGGSVVYSAPAMRHLSEEGRIVWLALSLPELTARLGDLAARGVVIAEGQDLPALFAEREPLYARYAHIVIRCDGMSAEAVARAILARIGLSAA